MNKFLSGILAIAVMAIVGCDPNREVVEVIDGKDGRDGYSLVATSSQANGEECSNGGKQIDVYRDLDRSGAASEGDALDTSYTLCNGLNGNDGTDGQDGEDGEDGQDGQDGQDGEDGSDSDGVAVAEYSSGSCTSLGGGYYGKSGSNSYIIYDDNDCHSSDKVLEMNEANSTFWFSSSKVGIFKASNKLRVLTLN